MLHIQEIQKTYDTGDEALKGVSVRVEENDVIAIIGPSGAGKSTLVKCVNRLVEPTGGKIFLGETELTSLTSKELRDARRDIGMIFQEYNLIDRLTVMENVLSGRLGYLSFWNALRRNFPSEDIERAYDTLELVGMAGLEDNRADELSGGQRQRVGIARAIIQQPKIILADEPTSSLDPETSRIVMELLREIAEHEGVPVLINIHEVQLAEKHADRIIGLTDGRKVFDGPPSELTDSVKDRIYRNGSSSTDRDSSADVPQSESSTVSMPKTDV